jgi:hypothetical protein
MKVHVTNSNALYDYLPRPRLLRTWNTEVPPITLNTITYHIVICDLLNP